MLLEYTIIMTKIALLSVFFLFFFFKKINVFYRFYINIYRHVKTGPLKYFDIYFAVNINE